MIPRIILVPTLLLLGLLEAGAQDWSDPVVVRRRAEPVVTYRVMLDGDLLVVEAEHAKGWHTYALDNVERARERSGEEMPETEVPTHIQVAGGLRIVGNWRQTKPDDLSQEALRWYTWGFSGRAVFAIRVKRAEGAEAVVTVNAQACDASACQAVRDVVLKLPLPTASAATKLAPATDLSQMVEVSTPLQRLPG